MKKIKIFPLFSFTILSLCLLFPAQRMASPNVLGGNNENFNQLSNVFEIINSEPQFDPESKNRLSRFSHSYPEREHTFEEDLKNQALLYGLAWAFYPITQPKILKGEGGFESYGKNFGKIVFDKDEPFWNWFVHPISGSQLYLFYRADGYEKYDAFKMTFITSFLFEFTVEIFTEPASVQDLYQTPVLGTILGLGIENFSMYLLNTGNPFATFLGHAINPATLLPIYKGRTLITPIINNNNSSHMDGAQLNFVVEF